ncbi:MAG: FMN reductase [uncultured Campylobacterales bacterium]|uniref:FMN reductase n=1 Tax=uncultured Campylobacterales bacterium TaxID=352960 RepID=A0A6S6SN76_9BACT|nr:MAG: FMN reductase [uncultured Campylobacterales bacterium]
MTEILIISATSNNNLALAKKIQENLTLSSKIIDIEELNLPLFTTKEAKSNGVPQEILDIAKQMIPTKAFIFVAPEYNGLTPPTLSNFIAWLSKVGDDFREVFNTKHIALATHSGGLAPKLMMAMRMQFTHLGANLIGREIITSYQKELNIQAVKDIEKEFKKIC